MFIAEDKAVRDIIDSFLAKETGAIIICLNAHVSYLAEILGGESLPPPHRR